MVYLTFIKALNEKFSEYYVKGYVSERERTATDATEKVISYFNKKLNTNISYKRSHIVGTYFELYYPVGNRMVNFADVTDNGDGSIRISKMSIRVLSYMKYDEMNTMDLDKAIRFLCVKNLKEELERNRAEKERLEQKIFDIDANAKIIASEIEQIEND